MFRWLMRLVIVGVLLVAVAGAALYTQIAKPYKGYDDAQLLLEIPRGSGSNAIAKILKDAGVIEDEWRFLAARAANPGAVLQAGEYQFKEPMSALDILDRLRRGDVYTFAFTVPEGSNIWDIARLLETAGIMKEKDFLQAASDPAMVRDLAPDAESLEGYLFPATYRLTRKTSARELCRMMVDQFRRQWKSIGSTRSVHDTITLASLVEEETAAPEERTLVAGVFTNRLRQGIQLACDPTVMYAARLAGNYRGTIYQSDLDRQHPYNTYKVIGLPPGPISSPGRKSIEAALHPAKTEAIYFMARPDHKGHVFSVTATEHNRAVAAYRSAENAGN
jgi:UPF0755 protein